MGKSESLTLLCMRTIVSNIIYCDYDWTNLFDLPSELFDCLLKHLPPVALEKLHEVFGATLHRSVESCDKHDAKEECSSASWKRARFEGVHSCGNAEISSLNTPNGGEGQSNASLLHEEILNHRKSIFNETWRTLFNSRWLDGVKETKLFFSAFGEDEARYVHNQHSKDWQQIYWETHLQNCLDEVAAEAVLPTFQGNVGDVQLSDATLESIGCEKGKDHSTYDYSKLSYHCQQFGCYARYLRLQNVFCGPETCVLLRNTKLHHVVFRAAKSKNHVDGICKILNQNRETLLSLEFMHCRLSISMLNDICGSLYTGEDLTHSIMYLSIKSSIILFDQDQHRDCPTGFLSFLTSGRSFCSLDISDSGLEPTFARTILDTLIDSASNIYALDFSDNRISGWLSPRAAASSSPACSKLNNYLRSLQVLNLRGNNLGREDAEDLKSALMYMPQLKHLEISDNPLEDDGIRVLVSYFMEHPKKSSMVDMNMENCDLSCVGGVEVLKGLSTLGKPLRSMSIAHNDLGRSVAVPLSIFLSTCRIQRLDIGAIGLGPSGFCDLEEALPSGLALQYLNISKNRGRLNTAFFLSKLFVHSPELVEVDAGYNFMPLESVSVIYAALKVSRGKLKRLDLTGNVPLCNSPDISLFDEFCYEEEPIVVVSSSLTSITPHDDDP